MNCSNTCLSQNCSSAANAAVYDRKLSQTWPKAVFYQNSVSLSSSFLCKSSLVISGVKFCQKNPSVWTVECMANERRVLRVAEQIRRELSEMFIHDKVVKEAISPERAFGADAFITTLATISDVEMSKDLQVAKVYVSVFGDPQGKAVALKGLKAKQGYMRTRLGKKMMLRHTPEVRIIEDDSFERGARVIQLLDKIKEEDAERERRRKERELETQSNPEIQ